MWITAAVVTGFYGCYNADSIPQEEARLRTRKAKEDLEKFLLLAPEMTSTLRFRKAEKVFEDTAEWQAVSERDRKDIFEDVQHEVAKREKVRLRYIA